MHIVLAPHRSHSLGVQPAEQLHASLTCALSFDCAMAASVSMKESTPTSARFILGAMLIALRAARSAADVAAGRPSQQKQSAPPGRRVFSLAALSLSCAAFMRNNLPLAAFLQQYRATCVRLLYRQTAVQYSCTLPDRPGGSSQFFIRVREPPSLGIPRLVGLERPVLFSSAQSNGENLV